MGIIGARRVAPPTTRNQTRINTSTALQAYWPRTSDIFARQNYDRRAVDHLRKFLEVSRIPASPSTNDAQASCLDQG
eukprot:78147-Pyramimonas_sp.AAC.1